MTLELIHLKPTLNRIPPQLTQLLLRDRILHSRPGVSNPRRQHPPHVALGMRREEELRGWGACVCRSLNIPEARVIRASEADGWDGGEVVEDLIVAVLLVTLPTHCPGSSHCNKIKKRSDAREDSPRSQNR